MTYSEVTEQVVEKLARKTREFYGNRLVSLAIFGSVARGTARPGSDIDILIIADDLPRGRLKRAFEFQKNVEDRLERHLSSLRKKEIDISISPVFKTREEVEMGSPLFLDMTRDVIIIFDRDGFLKSYLEKLKKRLEELGARRVQRGNAWYWILKPDYKYGEVIEL